MGLFHLNQLNTQTINSRFRYRLFDFPRQSVTLDAWNLIDHEVRRIVSPCKTITPLPAMWFFIAIQMASDVSLAILLTAESSLWTVSIKHGHNSSLCA